MYIQLKHLSVFHVWESNHKKQIWCSQKRVTTWDNRNFWMYWLFSGHSKYSQLLWASCGARNEHLKIGVCNVWVCKPLDKTYCMQWGTKVLARNSYAFQIPVFTEPHGFFFKLTGFTRNCFTVVLDPDSPVRSHKSKGEGGLHTDLIFYWEMTFFSIL